MGNDLRPQNTVLLNPVNIFTFKQPPLHEKNEIHKPATSGRDSGLHNGLAVPHRVSP